MSESTDFRGDVAELLAAVVEALDLPLPAVSVADEREHHMLLDRRSSDVRLALSVLLRHPGPGALDSAARDIRRWTASAPLTYTPFRFEERKDES